MLLQLFALSIFKGPHTHTLHIGEEQMQGGGDVGSSASTTTEEPGVHLDQRQGRRHQAAEHHERARLLRCYGTGRTCSKATPTTTSSPTPAPMANGKCLMALTQDKCEGMGCKLEADGEPPVPPTARQPR